MQPRKNHLRLVRAWARVEVAGTLPGSIGAHAGRAIRLVVFADHQVSIDGLALVPLADELPDMDRRRVQGAGGRPAPAD